MYEQKELISIGLMIGAFKPLVAIKLLNASTLKELSEIIYDELGIPVYRHEPIRAVLARIEQAFEKELRDYNAARKNQDRP